MASANKSSIHLGGLSRSTTESDIFGVFNRQGAVRDIRIVDNGNSNTVHAYVNFHHANSTESAIKNFNNTRINGCLVRVSASQRDASLRRSQKGNLVFKKLPVDLDQNEFLGKLSSMGEIVSSRFITAADGTFFGVGFVQFRDSKISEQVLETYNNADYKGSKLIVQSYRSLEDRKKIDKNSWTNVIVMNFDELLNEEELTKLAVNPTSVHIVMKEGKSAGRGFVSFNSNAEAVSFCEKYDGTKIGEGEAERKLMVTRHLTRTEYETEKKELHRKHRSELNKETAGRNLYVQNIGVSTTDEEFKAAFEPFGTISSFVVRRNKDKDAALGFGYCCFSSVAEADAAIRASKEGLVRIGDSELSVALYKSKEIMQKERNAREQANNRNIPANFNMMQAMPQAHGYSLYPSSAMGHAPTGVSMYPMNKQNHRSQQQQPAQQPVRVQPAAHQEGLRQSLENKSDGEVREMLGNLLYPKVQNVAQAGSDIGKITGMLLGMGTEEAIAVLEKPDSLVENVKMAEEMLMEKGGE